MITILAGGTGSAKLVRGFAALTKDLTIISNVGDNIWLHGLYVCPDIDTIVYALSEMLDTTRGWGIRNDTFKFLEELQRWGEPAWFSLGDRDLATHVLRTQMLRGGSTLSEITDAMRKRLGISAEIIPFTNDPVTTMIVTQLGKMHLQEFWVKNKARPTVKRILFEGARSAIASERALAALRKSSVIIIAPANPVSSIGPMLAIKGFRRALSEVREKVVAVSPIIGESAVSGPAVKYMHALGIENSPIGIAKYYADVAGSLVIAKSDHVIASNIKALGVKVLETDIIMKNKQEEIQLARYLVDRFKR